MAEVRATFLIMLGVILFSGALLVVLAPETIAEYTVIDTAFHRTDHRLIGKTAYNFNNVSDIANYPKKIDGWSGIDYRYPERVYETLDADIILSRAYLHNGKIIWMDIINSDTRKSFHDPRVCYGSKWNIVNEGVVAIPMNTSAVIFDKIYVNRLELESKKGDDKLVVLYWFMFRGGEGVTMIRLSSPASDYASTYSYMEDFVRHSMGVMYEKVRRPQIIGEKWIKEYGVAGWCGIVLLFMPSIVFIALGMKMNRR